jgi:4-hydroxybenzoate polyprenyltransferase/phosphoserine phosphatase
MSKSATSLPLCVDLDGTLILADLSAESLLKAVRSAPWIVLLLPFWLLRGRSYLKERLSRMAELDASTMPYDPRVVDLVRQAKIDGRLTILVTGSHRKYAEQINIHLRIFDEVVATEAGKNLTGSVKARYLQERFGDQGFEYVANGAVDLPVWQLAGAAVTVNAPRAVRKKVEQLGRPHADLPRPRPSLKVWLKAIRIHQWAKNILLFIPLIMAHRVLELQLVGAVLLAFVSFGCCASATYIINDLVDLDADRFHLRKRKRPFAAGSLSVTAGIVGAILLLGTGIALALFLPIPFQFALAAYIATTLFYSMHLKAVTSLDVLLLAGLYTLRIIAGTFAAGLALSFWLLAFSMFMFLCLALVKRVAELVDLRERDATAANPKLRGREYNVQDIPILQTMGSSSGYLAVLVLALYINSAEVLELYRSPQLLWLIAPLLLLWVTRLWVVTTRGYMNDDPIFFAIKDPETWITAACTGLILVGATQLTV